MPDSNTNAERKKLPITNCHTHIFTGDHVPPLLGKSIIRWPFYYLVNFRRVFYFFRRYYKRIDKKRYDGSNNLKARRKFLFWRAFKKNFILYSLYNIAGIYLTLQSIDILCHWVYPETSADPSWLVKLLLNIHEWMIGLYLIIHLESIWLQVLLLLVVVAFFKSGRNLLWFLAKKMISILGKLPGKETKKLFDRYLTIGRFAFHETQSSTLRDLEGQYPAGTRFVILPMDMEYMDAGKLTISYKNQMEELAKLKATRDHIFPFIFIDPRRMQAEGPGFFDYEIVEGRIRLKNCFIKEYIEDKKFSGFKIYPALGYYPFDPLLLPLWAYAQQEALPILTHCVRGPMYFRGRKKKQWDQHPIFQELTRPLDNDDTLDEKDFSPLLLPQMSNETYSANFTHPMNYACLLKREFLLKAVEIAWNISDAESRIKLEKLFGYVPANDQQTAQISKGLDDLKICFGHYGGTDEWKLYFEKDRSDHSAQIAKRPDFGIDFLYRLQNGQSTTIRSPGKPEQIWKNADWYSIISSLMLQHDKVYADISFILHDDDLILPLLKETLENEGLRKKVLYGTDFYVVRNLKSDKQMLASMRGGLEEKVFDQIARVNPVEFLKNNLN